MRFPRASGLLLHPTSLPGRFGIGDLGEPAYRFVDLLASTGQTYWQVLPLGPTGPGDSPYSTFSAFAGNPLLISPELLSEEGLLHPHQLTEAPTLPDEKVDYGSVFEWKTSLLKQAFESFTESGGELSVKFSDFRRENAWWLDDYATFRAIKSANHDQPWNEWPTPLRSRNADALESSGSQLSRQIQAERFYQFLFFSQWHALRQYANHRGVKFIGDIPIFVSFDSADVWCNQSQFKLNDDGTPRVVSGVPPDYFSKTGQLWGNPIYDWDAMRGDDFSWWTARVAFALRSADVVRLDHFIGFIRNWEVPAGDATAEHGQWTSVPGMEIFEVFKRRLGPVPLIAEDLGSMTAEVESLRDTFELPGMRILQYAFGGDSRNRDLPHNYVRNSVAYTGTHDNDTTAGWYKKAVKTERAFCRKYLAANGRHIHKDMIRAVFASVADTAIIPVQDLLGLGSFARMNTPATGGGNWQWRLLDGQLTDENAAWLREMTETYGRLQQ